MAFFSTWCPAGTSIEILVKVEGHRWAIEDSFETTKNELGLDHNETRSWHGWHRHVSLVMLAFAMMAAIRHHANATPPQKRTAKRRRQRPQSPIAIDPLVGPRNPSHRHPPCAKTDQPRSRHCMVHLATRTSSHRSKSSYQAKYATVMLGAVPKGSAHGQ